MDVSRDTTLAEHSIGVLWDGREDSPKGKLSPCEDILMGSSLPSAADARSMMLSGFAGKRTCLDAVREAESMKSVPVDGVLREQLEKSVSEFLSAVLHFASFHAQEASSNVTVSLKETSVHGRTFLCSNVEIVLFVTDSMSSRCDFDLSLLAEGVLTEVLEGLGFFIQQLGTSGLAGAGRVVCNSERSFRVSWYEPDVVAHMRQVTDASDVDAWRAGVPLEDILA